LEIKNYQNKKKKTFIFSLFTTFGPSSTSSAGSFTVILFAEEIFAGFISFLLFFSL